MHKVLEKGCYVDLHRYDSPELLHSHKCGCRQMTGCIFSLVQDTIYNNLDFHSICISQGKSPSVLQFLAWRLRRNHGQGKQKQ